MANIILRGEQAISPRQRAFEQGMNQIGNAFGLLAQVDAQNRERALAKEDRAEQRVYEGEKAQKEYAKDIVLTGMKEGIVINPNEATEFVKTGQISKDATGLQSLFSGQTPKKMQESQKILGERRRDLIKDRQGLDKEYEPFRRLFSTLGSLESKLETSGEVSGADAFQITRAFVPLSEINPGVVREGEFDLVAKQGSYIQRLSKQIENAAAGGGQIPVQTIKEMFDTARNIKNSISAGKVERLKNVEEEINLEGFDDKNKKVILGKQNIDLLANPESFAKFQTVGNSNLAKQPQQKPIQQAPRGDNLLDSFIKPAQAETMTPYRPHPETNQALEWARRNPKDPRALQIMSILGVQ